MCGPHRLAEMAPPIHTQWLRMEGSPPCKGRCRRRGYSLPDDLSSKGQGRQCLLVRPIARKLAKSWTEAFSSTNGNFQKMRQLAKPLWPWRPPRRSKKAMFSSKITLLGCYFLTARNYHLFSDP